MQHSNPRSDLEVAKVGASDSEEDRDEGVAAVPAVGVVQHGDPHRKGDHRCVRGWGLQVNGFSENPEIGTKRYTHLNDSRPEKGLYTQGILYKQGGVH